MRPAVPLRGALSGLLPDALTGAVSNDAVLAVVGAAIVAAMGILLEANRRWNNRLETTVTDKAQEAKEDTAAVAATVTEVRAAQAETNGRLHAARERLARLEGATEFVIARQTTVAQTARATHQAVVAVAHELQTDNGQSVGNLADADEGRRVRGIAVEDRTESEQGYVDRIEERERRDHESNGHSPPD